jgi:hypothetical protein
LEETGILVEQTTLVPIHIGFGRSMVSMTFLAQKIIGGKLLQVSKEGLPMWVHPHMLIKDTCSHYNLIVYKRLLSANLV